MTKTTTKNERITISLQQIMAATEMILKKAEINGLTHLTVGHDWYWYLNPDEAFDMVQPSPDLLVGDLYDDAEVVRDLEHLRDGLIGLHLTQIASIIAYIGSTYPSLYPVPRERPPTVKQ